MKEDDARLTPEQEEDLIGAVMRRTSGGACGRAEALLVRRGWNLASEPAEDQAITPEDLALLDAHLERCAACAALARSLALAADTLPSFAAFDPGPSLTAAVLAATSRAEPATLVERVTALWQAWLARPRFAFEVAYVATVLILIIVGNPASRLQAASERTVVAAAAGFERAREAWPTAVARVAPSIEVPASVRALGTATQNLIAERAAGQGGVSNTWGRVLAQWSVTWDWIQGVASDAVSRVASTMTSIRRGVSEWFNRPGTEPRGAGAR